jgi:hypothetical protein
MDKSSQSKLLGGKILFNRTLSARKISELLGQNVTVFAGGPVSRTGKLICVGTNFLAIKTASHEIIFYQLIHVRSVTLNSEDFNCKFKEKRIDRGTFRDVLRSFKYHKVSIDRGGPVPVVGVLNDINRQVVEVTVNDDIVFIPINKIKSISRVRGVHDLDDIVLDQSVEIAGAETARNLDKNNNVAGTEMNAEKNHDRTTVAGASKPNRRGCCNQQRPLPAPNMFKL